MGTLIRFLSYHNAVPVTLSLVLLGAGAAFAATPEVQDAVFQKESRVVAIDNTYLVQKDLSNYSPRVSISAVTEDTDAYYVSYTLSTINVTDGVWKDVNEVKTMKVDKGVLGTTLDLGLYVTEQLRQVVDSQVAYLREAQAIEQRQVSQKVIATEYSGLVGKFLDTQTEVLPGYVPVIVPPPAPVAQTPAEGQVASASGAAVEVPNTSSSTGDNVAPVLTVMGNNPARIPLRASYVDLGAAVTDNVQSNISIRYMLNGVAVTNVQIDTTVPGNHTIVYEATDPSGNTGRAERTVEVYDPAPPASLPPPVEESATTSEPVTP